MKVTHYHIEKGVTGLCKQHAIWGRDGNACAPLVYLQRPKWIKDDAVWEQLVNSIQLKFPKGKEVK